MLQRKVLVQELKKVNRFLTSRYMQVKLHEGCIWFHDDVVQYQSKKIDGIPEEWSLEFNSFELLKRLNAYKGDTVEFHLRGTTLTILCDFLTTLMVTEKDLDYLDSLNMIVFKEEFVNPNFTQYLAWVSRASSTDTTRPPMCGIGFGNMVMIATDGRRMHWTESVDIFRESDDFNLSSLFFVSTIVINAIIKGKLQIITSAYRMNSEGNTTVKFGLKDGGILILQQQNITMPNVLRVIPEYNELKSYTIDPKFYDLLQMVRNALKLQNDKSNAVILRFSDNTISVNYVRKWNTAGENEGTDLSEELLEVGVVSSNNSPDLNTTEIRLNVHYLLDAIKGISNAVPIKPVDFMFNTIAALDLELRFSNNVDRGIRAIVVETPGCKSVVMPMQV